MEKKCENVEHILSLLEDFVLQHTEKEIAGNIREIKISDALDSLSAVMLIVSAERKLGVEFRVEEFDKDETIASLAEKFYSLCQEK